MSEAPSRLGSLCIRKNVLDEYSQDFHEHRPIITAKPRLSTTVIQTMAPLEYPIRSSRGYVVEYVPLSTTTGNDSYGAAE